MAVLVAGMFVVTGTCKSGPPAQQFTPGQPVVVAKVGSYAITTDEIDTMMKQQGALTNPQDEAMAYENVLKGIVTEALTLQLAEKSGIPLTDADLEKQAEAAIDQQLSMTKLQLVMQNKLKPTATDADFQAEVQKETGVDFKTFRAQRIKAITDQIKDPATRPQMAAGLGRPILEAAIVSKLNPSEDEVKKSFEVLETKRIYVKGSDATATLNKALSEIKAGLSFEAAMNRYSNDIPSPGKTVSESTTTVSAAMMGVEPAKKALLDLKPGEVSGVIAEDQGASVYKLISVKSNLPKDYEQRKAEYKNSYAQTLARNQVDKDLADLEKTTKIEWQSKGYKAIYDLRTALENHGSNEDFKKALQAVEQEASAANNDSVGEKVAGLANYVASNTLWSMATDAEKKAMLDSHVDAINQVLEYSESTDLRLELCTLFMQMKKGPEAARSLIEAARNNNDVSDEGQRSYNAIMSMESKLKAAGLLAQGDEKALAVELDRWRSDKADAEKAIADQKKRDEEDLKQSEAEKKKDQAADAAKAAAKSGK